LFSKNQNQQTETIRAELPALLVLKGNARGIQGEYIGLNEWWALTRPRQHATRKNKADTHIGPALEARPHGAATACLFNNQDILKVNSVWFVSENGCLLFKRVVLS
jgi:hypothetical protein